MKYYTIDIWAGRSTLLYQSYRNIDEDSLMWLHEMLNDECEHTLLLF